MKNFTTCICIMGLSGIAYGDVVMDQIGADDGSSIDTSNMTANQDFETTYDGYDIATVDDFTGAGEAINSVELVMGGWNGYVDISGVTGFTANLYSGSGAAEMDLVGDIASQFVDAADANVSATWAGVGGDLVQLDVSMVAGAGLQLMGVLPANEFATNGQTGAAVSFDGDGMGAGQANPSGAFGFTWQAMTTNVAFRISSGGAADPCDSALGFCPEDIDGNGAINVDDLLIVMGNWGQTGDGTFRPAGDVYPAPNGDCNVNVDDLLAMMGAFGGECIIDGGCCLGDGTCSVETPANCAAAGGDYFGDDSTCADGDCAAAACCINSACSMLTADACASAGGFGHAGYDCSSWDCSAVIAGDECADALVAIDGANPFDTSGMTANPDLPTCAADELAFGWEVPTNDIWFSFTASATGSYDLDTCDAASFDTSVVVYDACGGNAIACNGDGTSLTGCQTYYSELQFDANAGSTYYIRIGGWGETDMGSGTLNINATPDAVPGSCCMADDNCIDGMSEADCVAFGGSYNGDSTVCAGISCAAGGDYCDEAVVAIEGGNAFDTSLATPSAFGQPDDTMCAGEFLDWDEAGPDVWMVYTPAGAGSITVSLCDAASYDTSLVLYAGNSCSALTQVACNGDTTVESGCQAYYSGVYDMAVTGTEDIYIRIGGWQGDSGAGTCTITYTQTGATGACCVGGACIGENTMPECDAFGGLWNNGMSCADVECPAVYTAGGCDVDEGCVCFVDGDDSETDCNGGGNLVVPTYGTLNIGESVCGTSSVFVDGPTGGTYRDLDWFHSAAINAGGTFDVTIGANSTCQVLFLNEDTGTVDFAADHMAGHMNTTTLTIPAGNWAIIATVNDWNTAWICGSGLETYTML